MGRDRRTRGSRAAGVALLLAAASGAAACSAGSGAARLPTPTPTPVTVSRDVVDVAVGEQPVGLAIDDRGRLWSVNSGSGSVVRLDEAGEVVAQSVPVGERPLRAVWWAGGLWVTVAGDQRLVRVDGRTGQVTTRVALAGEPDGIVAAFGSLWVVLPDPGLLVRVDPDAASPHVRASFDVGRGARRVAAGGDALWVSDYTSGTLVKVDPTRGVEGDPIRVCVRPQGMLARDGLLWVACTGADKVVAVDERAGGDEQRNALVRQVGVEGAPDSLAPASDGQLWVSLRAGPTLALLDPQAEEVRSRWPVSSTGTPPEGSVDVMPIGPRVWLSSYERGRVEGIDVTPQGR